MRYVSIDEELIKKVIDSLNKSGDREMANELLEKLIELKRDQVSGAKLD